ncbi:hypothetical protein TNCV_2784481 [Trichonephila clavipes]|nr:hypothetical protein TNCV_2784481 [Trichonephila clavipes]
MCITETHSPSHVELMKKHQLLLLMTHHAPMQFYSTVATAPPSKWLNLTNMTSNKADAIPEELKSCALKQSKKYIQKMSGFISTLMAHTCQKQTEPALLAV